MADGRIIPWYGKFCVNCYEDSYGGWFVSILLGLFAVAVQNSYTPPWGGPRTSGISIARIPLKVREGGLMPTLVEYEMKETMQREWR